MKLADTLKKLSETAGKRNKMDLGKKSFSAVSHYRTLQI